MTNRPKQIGTACETAVVRFLNANGFAGAERSALHGSIDVGDITGTPGIAWEVKGGHAAEDASDGQIAAWLTDTELERRNRGADLGVLVLKRKGKGAASAGQWWAFLLGRVFVQLGTKDGRVTAFAPSIPPVRISLGAAVYMLRQAGYGDALERTAP